MQASADNGSGKLRDKDMIEMTGTIMVLAIILLFFLVLFLFSHHLYTRLLRHRRQQIPTTTRRRRRRFDFAAGYEEIMFVPSPRLLGLDPRVLKTIPVVTFDPNELKDGLDCAVCLCEVSEGEKARILPRCNHGFHVECIDMWFHSHSTCPLCRNPVSNQKQLPYGDESTLDHRIMVENSTEAPSFPTDIYAPCTEESEPSMSTSSSSSSMVTKSNIPDGMGVIDIPGTND